MVKAVRYPENPLLTPRDVPPLHPGFEVIGAFNAGVCRYRDEILLLLRVAERPVAEQEGQAGVPVVDRNSGKVQVLWLDSKDPRYDFSDPRVIRDARTGEVLYLTSLSYLRIARSKDGRRFTVEPKAFLYPGTELETFGVEDPRITQIEDRYYITYTAVSDRGIAVGLVSTRDFESYERLGYILPPENKDVVLFPEKINGKYYALHRPVPKGIGKPEIWIAESPDLKHWGNHRFLLGVREGTWESARIGAGAVPIKTDKGWLELYHGADAKHRYCMGAVLLDLEDPSKVLARAEFPILEPETEYERVGFFGDVVFGCGALQENGKIILYYGVSDSSMACVEFELEEILKLLTR